MEANSLKRLCGFTRLAAISMVFFLAFILPAGCETRDQPVKEIGEISLTVSSPAFQEGSKIPAGYTCDGQDVSPALTWSEPPAETQAFALIVDDPDAPSGAFTHWLIFNIPPESRQLAEATPAQAQLPNGALQGKSDFGNIGYGGPCPPAGKPHHYQFTLYALDQALGLKAGATKKQLLSAMEGHILAEGRLTGIYQR